MLNILNEEIMEDIEMHQSSTHIPVLSKEVVEHLNLKGGQVIVDGTVGLGGHAKMILPQIGASGRYIAIDRDEESLVIAQENLKVFETQCRFVQDDYRHIDKILKQLEIFEVDGILLDLGVSSFQLDNPERGFSIKGEGPLDMRMDKKSYISAYDLINSLSEKEISSILRNFGEERFHNRIARCLVAERMKKPIESTKDLTEIILKALPYRYQHQRIHPATRTFQAIRIAVNRELESLEIVLEKSLSCLKMGARMCIIAFHSLEDRIVKEKFKAWAKSSQIKLIVKKPLWPSEEEIESNPRARSARLRVAERIS